MCSKSIMLIMMLALLNGVILPTPEKENRNELINQAIQVSPRIKMLNSKRKVSMSKIDQDTNLPDPVLTLGLVNLPTNSFSFNQEPMTGKVIGLSQNFPFPGGLESKSEAIAIDTLIIAQEIEDYKNEIRKNVSLLYYDLQLVREEKELTRESILLLEQIAEVVRSKYTVSESSLQNLIQIQSQITKVKDKIEILNGKENATLAELNVFLLREENSPIQTERLPVIDRQEFSSTYLLNKANENRPFLKGIQLAEQKSKLLEESAKYSYYPNFSLGLQYMQRDYSSLTGQNWNDLFSFIVGVTLPLGYGGSNFSKSEEAKYLQKFYRDQYSASVQSLNQSLVKIIAKINELKIRNKLISETLLPQTEQSLQAALADYKVGSIDFINVINAENEILTIKIELIKIRAEHADNIAQLEFLVGTELNESDVEDNGELK